MGDMSAGDFSLKNHNISQHYCDPNNGDMSIGCGFKNSHTLYKCEDYSKFKKIDDDVEGVDGDVSSVYVF